MSDTAYSQNLVRDYQTRIAGLPHPVQPMDVQYPNWSALGHAIDYRLRLSLGGRLGPAVAAGVMLLDGTRPLRGAPARASLKALHTAGRELLATVETYLADPSSLDEKALIRLCFVAGFFEDVARTGEIRRFSMLAHATPATILDDLTGAVPEYAVTETDIHTQMRLADGPFTAFRALPASARVCGPVFTGSSDIGGADADYILDGLLLDCKATKDPRRLGREEIYQLAGYLLLDYDDQFGIHQVGLYLSRQAGLITWNAADFLRRLGASAPQPQLRARFRQHLHDAARP
ncbi:hypothetical protein [Streptomyces sp. NPDC046161]|uniref:hypothetical protein n=1 Tax=Streptomyces sp. NPDC046161 TaxID=3155132 RepID=UPI0034045FDC